MTRSTNRVLLYELCGISPTALVFGGSAFARRQQEEKKTVVDFKAKTASALTDNSHADNEDSGNDGANNIGKKKKRIPPTQRKSPARKCKRWYGSSDKKKAPQSDEFDFPDVEDLYYDMVQETGDAIDLESDDTDAARKLR